MPHSPKYGKEDFPANFECSWNFIASRKCIPQIVCPEFELKQVPDCATDHLAISDAVGGELKLCGNASFTRPKVATKGA